MTARLFQRAALTAFLADAARRVAVMPLGKWREGTAGLILRHDVDFDPLAALELAELEHDVGVRSSFFIITTMDTYNPASPESRRIFRRMLELGCEIGLHFDAALPRQCGDLAAACRREADWLADIIGAPVRSVSLHNPSASGEFPLFDGFHNAYDPRIFAPDRYLSDSCMTFLRSPAELIERATTGPAQLLLHPEHYSPDGAPYPMPQVRRVMGVIDSFHNIFCANRTYGGRVDSLRQAVAEQLQEHTRS